jgi:MFS family permease
MGPTKILILVVSIYFFTSNLTSSFLPIYFRDSGLNLLQIIEVLLFTFLVIGLLPVALLKKIRNFESIIIIGIFTTMLFFIALIYVKNPIVLGLAQGISMATFWPSFNLLQFRATETERRARTISLYSSVIPALASIVGPATGGLIIEGLGFTSLFVTSMMLYLVALLFSIRVHFRPEEQRFAIPKSKTFAAFFMTFVVGGLTEAYWLAYPFFVYSIAGTVLNMGLVLAASGILVSAITFSVNWLSDVKRTRVEFAVTGTVLSATWYFAIGFASSMDQVVFLSLLSGLANALHISWFAYYADCFNRESYASLLVMMEVGLMMGRTLNLIPAYVFVSQANYTGYFALLGIITPVLIPLYIVSRRNSNSEKSSKLSGTLLS